MDAAKPISFSTQNPINKEINSDLLKTYKDILFKYLDDRSYKEDKVKIWAKNILEEAKEYFIKKYDNYNLFLLIAIYPRNVYFRSGTTSISVENIDWCDLVDFKSNNIYAVLYFFFYQNCELTYSLENYESEIIKKGNEILLKHLDERKFNYDKILEYNTRINDEFVNTILEKENKLKAFLVSEIYQNPLKDNYFFTYLNHGKQIYSKIFHNYVNDSLTCCHSLYFFK